MPFLTARILVLLFYNDKGWRVKIKVLNIRGRCVKVIIE